MPDLLFEIGVEELPSWYVAEGSGALRRLLRERLEEAEVGAESYVTYGTPRRLAVLAKGLPERSAQRVDELRGPPESAAFDDEGRPKKAAVAFATKQGVDVSALEVRDTDKGRYVYATVKVGGEATRDLLPEVLASVATELPARRKMRWGDEDTPFLRPVAWLLAMLGSETLTVEAFGLRSGTTTRGHRFLAPAEFELSEPAAYAERLRDAWVLADRAERHDMTESAISAAAAEAGLVPLQDDDLLSEVVDLVEWPFPILGSFREAYLELPDEVLATVMIKHQRFFPTRVADGRLAPSFVGVSNNHVADEGIVRKGYEQVLEGRLYDASFFWHADRQKSLSQHAWGLSGIAFQQKLGSMADKVERVGRTAQQLVATLGLGPDEGATVGKALPLFRADLATEMVNEFPELEGVMARAYALAEGLPAGTADALLGGVEPRSYDSALPQTAAGAVLALADRADNLVGFFALGKKPTGSADPFGLRRDALAIARILGASGWTLPVSTLVQAAADAYDSWSVEPDDETVAAVTAFVWDRVAAALQERAATPVVRAAIRGSDTIDDAARRVELLSALMEAPEFADLMALYKRAANLAEKSDGDTEIDPSLFTEPAEAPLAAALDVARDGVAALLGAVNEQLPAWDVREPPTAELVGIADAVAEVVSLKAPLDAFLDDVLVMVDNPHLRANRLALLTEVARVLEGLGELSELEGAAH